MKRKRDNQRYSIIRPFQGTCIVCGGSPVEIHECIPGTANRQKCIQDGLCVELCPIHHRIVHENGQLMTVIRNMGKLAYLETHTRNEFIERYGRAFEEW